MNAGNLFTRERLYATGERLKNHLFEFLCRSPGQSLPSRIGNYVLLAVAYLVGVFHWAWLINFGNVASRSFDWQKFFDYYGVIQKALAEKTIPYFMPYFYKGTNQFLALPETDLSPTVFLLNFMSVQEFFLAQCLILYSLGFAGCLLLKRKYQWSLTAFLFFFLMFNFNGHITAHMAMGHWPWISYFLFPYFLIWVMNLVENDPSQSPVGWLALLLFGMLLLGGLHPFVWCLISLFLLCLFQKRYWKPIFIEVALAGVFSSYRIIPAAINFFGYENSFFYGFPSVSTFWGALTRNHFELDITDMRVLLTREPVLWELDHYVGIIGLAVILYFGVWARMRDRGEEARYTDLNAPLLLMTLLSIGPIFGWITSLPIPLISVERVSARFLIIPLLFLLTLSCIWMQRNFERLRPTWSVLILALAILIYEGYSLRKHWSLWKETTLVFISDINILRLNDPDSLWAKQIEWMYVPAVHASYLISIATLLAFAGRAIYLKNKCSIPEEKVDQ